MLFQSKRFAMSLPRQSMLIGFLFIVGAAGGRIRRHDFFSFPTDDDRFGYRGHFRDDFVSDRFEEEEGPNRNQFFGPQPPANRQDFQTQGRVPFTTPILPGPPAIIDSPQQRDSSTVRPDTVVTTASPAFFACMQNCPTTSEYNPICGTNRQLYFNMQKFDCAVRCGARTQIWRRGSCAGLFPMQRG